MAARKKTNPGASNFKDLGYNEFKMTLPMYTKRISTDEVAENSEPEIKKKKDKRLNKVRRVFSVQFQKNLHTCSPHERVNKKVWFFKSGLRCPHPTNKPLSYGYFLEQHDKPINDSNLATHHSVCQVIPDHPMPVRIFLVIPLSMIQENNKN